MADFQSHYARFAEQDIRIVAGSVDNKADAEQMVKQHDLSYPVAYGLDARAVSQTVGAYFHSEKGYLQPAGFIIDPDSRVYIACYSSGNIGRLHAAECLEVIK